MQRLKEEQAVIEYLLGQADEAEQTRIEIAYFHDHKYHERMLALEDDLIHEYLSNGLSAQERSLFERHFLASHRRRGKYEFAKHLAAYTDQTKTTTRLHTNKATSWWKWLLPVQPKPAWAAACAALVLCGGIWWALNSAGKTSTSNQSAAVDRIVAEKQPTSIEPQSTVSQTGSGKTGEASTSQPLNVVKPTTPKSAQPKMFAVTLALLSGREAGDYVTIRVPTKYESVQLLVPASEFPLYPGYEASIKTIDGEKLFHLKNLKGRKAGAKGLVVPVMIPAKQLPQSECVLTMYGATSSGQTTTLGNAFFSVRNE